MKKLFIIGMLLCLCACSNKKISFEEISKVYDVIQDQVEEEVNNIKEFVYDDYKKLLTEIANDVQNVSFKLNQEDQDLLSSIYQSAYEIKTIVSKFDNETADELVDVCDDVLEFVKAAYDGNEEEFNEEKQDVLEEIAELNNWAADKWNIVEKRINLDWNTVENEFEALEDKIENSFIASEVTLYDFEDYKNYIIDNYSSIKDGVNENNIDIAKQIYASATKLEEYVDDADCLEAKQVEEFAEATKDYVESCLGKILDADDLIKPYDEYISDASKWTQSVFNQIEVLVKAGIKD